METVEMVYYVCLNNDCPKHRNVFLEGDPRHERCARERVLLEGQREPMPVWLRIAIPSALAALAAIVVLVRMARARQQGRPPMLRGESEMKTWSGAHAHRDDREGNPVPPPIA